MQPPNALETLSHDAVARVHGGLHDAELAGIDPEAVIDFSSSTNPYGPAPAMLRALQEAVIGRYPDPSGERARAALGAALQIPSGELVLGNGAADLLWSVARCLLGPGRRALIIEPTFCEFRAAACACGAAVSEWRSRASGGFAVDTAAVEELARASGVRALYLCSPNTPTGLSVPIERVSALARALPATWVVLDQSFSSLSERHAETAQRLPANVIVIRSLTKDHGIPGVRVGYAIASAALCRALEAARPAWTTSAFAQAAVVASCECAAFVAESRERLLEDRRALARDLLGLGIPSLPSETTFLMAAVHGTADLRRRLLARHRILVRDCASFGLPGFMRLGAKPPWARSRLIAALRAEGARP